MATKVNAGEDLGKCADILRTGGVVVHATEGVFGFACSVQYSDAIERITELKGRDRQASPFLVLAATMQQVATLVSLDVAQINQVERSWPGAITWVFPEKSESYSYLGGADGSLAVRLTGHRQARTLIGLSGPLVSTSANPHGKPAALEIAAAQRYFGGAVDYYLAGELETPGHPSEIWHAESGERLR